MTIDPIAEATLDCLAATITNTKFENQVFVAGGFCRDAILGIPSKDIDLVVTMPNGGVEFAHWITTQCGVHTPGNPVIFERFGTAKFNLRGVNWNGVDVGQIDIEAVMPRTEVYTKGSRKPTVGFTSLEQDAARRDFTINSLFMNVNTREILDFTKWGVSDIKSGIIRTAMASDLIMKDDPLRMLRAVRFAAKFGWHMRTSLRIAIARQAHLITTISAERIQEELSKMLVSNHPAEAMEKLFSIGLLQHIIPEMVDARGFTQNAFHDDDVWNHSLKVLSLTPPDLKTRLAAFLHDVGKMQTRTFDEDGQAHFYRHEDVGADIAETIMTRLKFSTEMITAVKVGVRQHMRLKQSGKNGEKISDKALRKFVADLGEYVPMVLDIMDADNKSHAPEFSMPDQIAGIRARLANLPAMVAAKDIKLPINGKDVMEHLNIKPSKRVAIILDAVRDAYFEDPTLTEEAALNIVEGFR